jgi:hypothetical protein
MHQEPLTVVANVSADKLVALRALLAQMHDDPANNSVIPFARLDRAHFARLFVLDPELAPDGQQLDAQLVLMSDCDGSAAVHLEEIVDVAAAGIDQVFGHCEDYPQRPATREQRVAYLRAHTVPTATYYAHRVGRSVAQIRSEALLRDALERYLDGASFDGLSADAVRERIRTFVESDPSLAWALEPVEPLELRFRLRELAHELALPAGALAAWPVVVPATILLLLLVRLHELRDPAPHKKPTREHIEELASLVDFGAQNPYSVVGFVKPGWLRRTTLGVVLQLANYGTRHLYNRDNLGGVKTIHFARWVPLDDKRRVLFTSNYDGSLEAYMDDFIDKIAWGLNLVFSNGVGYPKTRWLVFDGAKREQEFKDINVRQQVPTRVWYTAYGDLTTLNIENNEKIRAGLRGRMNEQQAQQWLSLL